MSRSGNNRLYSAASISHWSDAWRWVCYQRRNAPANADIWDLRFHWNKENSVLFHIVNDGYYRLSPLQVFYRKGNRIDAWAQWSARDALVLKWVSLHIRNQLPLHPRCMHVAGQGSAASLRLIATAIENGARYVYRTDIRGYYRHIIKEQLYNHVCRFITDPVLRGLIRQYIYYTVEDGGDFYSPENGICRGCALSPLFGASLLWYIDSYYAGLKDLVYVRYMDDFIFLSDRRWPIRRAKMRLYDYFDMAGFECHPDKTQNGKIERGFDWLGVWFTAAGATGIAPRALDNHRQRRLRLEEQARRKRLPDAVITERVQRYEGRWKKWAKRQLLSAIAS